MDATLSVPSAPHEPSQEAFPQVSGLRYSLLRHLIPRGLTAA